MSELRSRVLGVGGYVPSRVVTNRDLEELMDTSSEWIIDRTGIEERRSVEEGEGGAEMGVKAAEEALERAGLHKSAIDQGKVKRGDLVCRVGFGAGLTWGSGILRY